MILHPIKFVGFDDLTPVVMKSSFLRDVTTCSPFYFADSDTVVALERGWMVA
jgi:hypothetical protein